MPTYVALQCAFCTRYQVTQDKVAKKFACAVCGQKQSFRQVHAISNKASDLRKVVQELNELRGAQEQACGDVNPGALQAVVQPATSKAAPAVEWDAFAEATDDADDFDDLGIAGGGQFVTALPDSSRGGTGRASKRRKPAAANSTEHQPEQKQHYTASGARGGGWGGRDSMSNSHYRQGGAGVASVKQQGQQQQQSRGPVVAQPGKQSVWHSQQQQRQQPTAGTHHPSRPPAAAPGIPPVTNNGIAGLSPVPHAASVSSCLNRPGQQPSWGLQTNDHNSSSSAWQQQQPHVAAAAAAHPQPNCQLDKHQPQQQHRAQPQAQGPFRGGSQQQHWQRQQQRQPMQQQKQQQQGKSRAQLQPQTGNAWSSFVEEDEGAVGAQVSSDDEGYVDANGFCHLGPAAAAGHSAATARWG